MATVTGYTATRMLEIENGTVIDGEVVGDNLILTTRGGTDIDAGSVRGATGPMGSGPGILPGEVRIWPGTTLPTEDPYGLWVWADGSSYAIADHPLAAAHIADAWNTAGGLGSPGAGNFRVPDLRGVVPAGLDTMPGGSPGARMSRSEADTMAAMTGEEYHQLTIAELAAHDHDIYYQNLSLDVGGTAYVFFPRDDPLTRSDLILNAGGDTPHETVQPTVMVAYIVALDT